MWQGQQNQHLHDQRDPLHALCRFFESGCFGLAECPTTATNMRTGHKKSLFLTLSTFTAPLPRSRTHIHTCIFPLHPCIRTKIENAQSSVAESRDTAVHVNIEPLLSSSPRLPSFAHRTHTHCRTHTYTLVGFCYQNSRTPDSDWPRIEQQEVLHGLRKHTHTLPPHPCRLQKSFYGLIDMHVDDPVSTVAFPRVVDT